MEYKCLIDGVEYTSAEIFSGELKQVLFAEYSIGNACSAQFTITYMPQTTPARMAEVIPYYREHESLDWSSLGVFYIDERTLDKGKLTLVCFDAMLKTEQPYLIESEELVFPVPQSEAVVYIAGRMGVELDEENVIDDKFVVDYPNDYTMREVLCHIAVANAGNWIMSSTGKLRLIPFKGTNRAWSIGQKMTSLKVEEEQPHVSKVTVFFDDENCYEAGNDNGYELIAFCPSATQEMVDNIHSAVSGYRYCGFEAKGAEIPNNVSVGDGVIADSYYLMIAERTLRFGPDYISDISAPYSQEVDHEYGYAGKVEKELKRKVALGKSYYGTKITRADGLVIESTDGETVTRRAQLNSKVLAFYDDDGKEVLYFDPVSRKYKFVGDVTILSDYATTSSVIDMNSELTEKYNQMTKIISLGNEGVSVGAVNSPNKVVVDNDSIDIKVNDVPVQTFDATGRAIIPNLSVTKAVNIFGYAIKKTGTGNINCKWVGE